MRISTLTSSINVRTLRVTSLTAAIFAFALVVWGAIVRISGAGMTCPDWPRCRGAWIPELGGGVAYEWVHRLGAPILALLIVATIVAAWRARREVPNAWRVSWFAGAMLVAQILAGALTIKTINSPPSVALHLGLGILTFVSVLLVWHVSQTGAHTDDHLAAPSAGALAFARLALSTTIVAFVAILAAGYMSASNAGLACTQFPLCNGWGPPHDVAQQIHMGHRLFAYAAFVMIVALSVSVGPAHLGKPLVSRLTWTVLVLGTLQIALGVLTIASGLAPVLRSVHQANGALLFAALSLLTYAAYAGAPEPAAAAQARAQVASQQPS